MDRKKKRELAALIYPVRCPVCGEFIAANGTFCPECADKLVKYSGSFQIKGSAGFTAAYEYNSFISPAVMLMKDGIMGNAPYAFGAELAERITASGMNGADIIVPAPLHKADRRRRGANQSLFIARELGLRLGIPVNDTAVEKTSVTLPQKELKKHERELNLHGAFTVAKPEEIAGKTVIVVDDICTTGSTLAELTSALLSAGAKKVYCACACKTPDRQADNEKTEV